MLCLKALGCQNAETQQGLHSWERRCGKSSCWVSGSGVYTLLFERGALSLSLACCNQFSSHFGL